MFHLSCSLFLFSLSVIYPVSQHLCLKPGYCPDWPLGPAVAKAAVVLDLGPMSRGRPLVPSTLREVPSTKGEGRHWLFPPALALAPAPFIGKGPLTDWVLSVSTKRRLQPLLNVLSWLKRDHTDMSENGHPCPFRLQPRLMPRLAPGVSPVSPSSPAQCSKCGINE